MRKKIIFFILLFILIIFTYFNNKFIYSLICFQDFSYFIDEIQILSSSYFSISISFILNIVLRSLCNITLCYISRKIISPLPYNYNTFIYILIFFIFFIPIPFRGYILLVLSLFPISLFYTFILMNFASLPSLICQVICQKKFVFNDYKFSLFIGIMCISCIYFYFHFHEKKV